MYTLTINRTKRTLTNMKANLSLSVIEQNRIVKIFTAHLRNYLNSVNIEHYLAFVHEIIENTY